MDITRRCDYACRIIRAAYRSQGSYRSVSDIASEEGIPYAFARSIQHELVQAGLIETVRGARGGLRLCCDPRTTTLLDVLEAVQGPVAVASCSNEPALCEKSACCEYNRVWTEADQLLRDHFASYTLSELLEDGAVEAKSSPCADPAIAIA